MPQVSAPPQKRWRWTRSRRFLLMAGLSIFSLVAMGEFQQEQVRASETRANQVNGRSIWRAASFPVENFQAYTSPYGYRPSPNDSSGWEFHHGLDIAAPEGSYIRNWWIGTVVELSDNTLCGTSITIQSGEWKHTYCHMKGHVESVAGGRYLIDREGGILIGQGQQISAGVRIGRVGMTGRTTGPHLHWGLKYSGNYVDPALVLQAMYAQRPETGQQPVVSSQWLWQGQALLFGDEQQTKADY